MVYTDEAFVIKKSDMLNEDKVVQLFTRLHGRISCVAKGVKKSTSRKAGNLELLNRCSVSLATGKNLEVLTEIKLLDDYEHLRSDESGVFFLFFVDEIASKMIYEGEVNEDVFTLIAEVLSFADTHPPFSKKKLLGYLNAKMLLYSGVFPEVMQCLRCGERLEEDDEKVYARSGIAHARCMAGRPIDTNTIKVLRFLREHNLAAYSKVRTGESLDNTIYSLTIDMIEYTIGSSIRSKVYINGAK